MNSRVYPINIAGIKNTGTEKWLKNYFIPVTGIEFNSIYGHVSTSFLDSVKQYNDDVIYWIAISNLKIINTTSLWISEVLRLIRLKERGYEYVIGTEKVRVPNDISVFGYEYLSEIDFIGKVVSSLNFQEKIKNVLRTIKYNLNPSVFANKNFLTNIPAPFFFTGCRDLQEVGLYCKQNEISPVQLPLLLFANNRCEEDKKESEHDDILELVHRFLVLIKKQFPEINSQLFGLLRKELEGGFISSLLFFKHNFNAFSRFKPKKLLATGLGNPIARLSCASYRHAGGEVVGFNHGNNYCYGYNPETLKLLVMVDQYVTVTAGHKELLQETVEKFPSDLRMGSITFIKQSYYKQLFTEHQRKKPVNEIKKIMIVGFPMTGLYYSFFPSGYAYTHLDLELRLGKLLMSNGYYVVYKPHPSTSNDIDAVFEGYADKVIKDRFEDVMGQVDCVIFGNFSTTAFGYSLPSNKPIVLIDVKGNYWHPRAFGLIKKRCSVVEVDAVEGRIVFDDQDVLDAVDKSLENINYDILYEYAF
ncbi:MAG: hypothetical protein CMI55_01845 [Parcubacteria group bacterium]|nr:hypothetical protein [Parcubacteria group bacterium]